jgi:lipopolysaccharide transport system ATP-binding protein
MSDLAIRVDGIGKKYLIGGSSKTYDRLGDQLLDSLVAPFQRARNLILGRTSSASNLQETFWALKDISFEVRKGEVLGIIGRNGAGKSTILKILSRITEPTEGFVDLYGRVGSLLEVGTGFHPELTGRENVYLNGAILGMNVKEIERKMSDIIDFAEIAQFMDTPVKHYSSGMYVRLAFSVAAHLEPDILLVDEVLAVGDIAFQQKCLNHMRNLTRSGMTIILVSHNMAAIQSSCGRALLIDKGELIADGQPVDIINKYQNVLQTKSRENSYNFDIPGHDKYRSVSILDFDIIGEDGRSQRELKFGESIKIRIDLMANDRINLPMINFGILRGDGVPVCNFNNWYDNFRIDYIEGKCTLEGWLPPLRLVPAFYEIHVLVWHWGGGHLQGDLTRVQPIAWSTFGDFRVVGPALNAHDGVFQIPAVKWCFIRNGHFTIFDEINQDNIYQAFFDE